MGSVAGLHVPECGNLPLYTQQSTTVETQPVIVVAAEVCEDEQLTLRYPEDGSMELVVNAGHPLTVVSINTCSPTQLMQLFGLEEHQEMRGEPNSPLSSL